MFKNNLIISKNNNFEFLKFIKDNTWKDSLRIVHDLSWKFADSKDVFFILKSYIEHESAVVTHLFLVLTDTKLKIKNMVVLQPIPLFDIKKIIVFEEFDAWWNFTLMKIGHYETDTHKIDILLILQKKIL